MLQDGTLLLHVTSLDADPSARARYDEHVALAGRPSLPLIPADAAGDTLILVVAFDCLMKVSKSTWEAFGEQFWIDAPVSWAGDYPASGWAKGLKIPPKALEGAAAVVLIGYGVRNGFRFPSLPSAWEAA